MKTPGRVEKVLDSEARGPGFNSPQGHFFFFIKQKYLIHQFFMAPILAISHDFIFLLLITQAPSIATNLKRMHACELNLNLIQ